MKKFSFPEETIIVALKVADQTELLPPTARITIKKLDYLLIQQYRAKSDWSIEMAPLNAGLQISVRGIHPPIKKEDYAIVRVLMMIKDIYDDAFAKEVLDWLYQQKHIPQTATTNKEEDYLLLDI